MKLWYTRSELRDARAEAQRLVDQANAEIPYYINGDVRIRMAWKEDRRSDEVTPLDELRTFGEDALTVFLPEAEILVNGEVTACDLLDLILIDINKIEMKVLQRSLSVHRLRPEN